MSTNGDKRQRWKALRCFRMREAGHTLGEIAKAENVNRDAVANRIKLGERLSTLAEFQTKETSDV